MAQTQFLERLNATHVPCVKPASKQTFKSLGMEQVHPEDLTDPEDMSWSHIARRQLVSKTVQSRFPPLGHLIEGGVGSSGNLLEFADLSYDVTRLDATHEVVTHSHRRSLSDIRQHDLSEPWPAERASVCTVVMLDVLTHMIDPIHVLRNAAHFLHPGGDMMTTVPASPLFCNSSAERLGHRRRYTADVLRSKATVAGLKVEQLTHWNSIALSVPCMKYGVNRLFGQDSGTRTSRHSPTVNSLVVHCAAVEREWLARTRVSAGLSIVGVLSK